MASHRLDLLGHELGCTAPVGIEGVHFAQHPAQRRFSLDQLDRQAGVGQRQGSGHAGQPSADDQGGGYNLGTN